MNKAYMNWSGGKDAALALYHILQQKKFDVACLLTSVNTNHDRISMHGVRRSLLQQQAVSLRLPLETLEMPEQPTMPEYEDEMMKKILSLRKRYYYYSVFGDIFLEDLKKYREEKLNSVGLAGIYPLWKRDTGGLIREVLQLGFKMIVVCVNDQYLDKSFCGRIIDEKFISDLPANVDPCGENGEFHTFVFDGPVFSYPIEFTKGELIYKEYAAPKIADDNCHQPVTAIRENYGFWFCDIIPTATKGA